MPSPFAVNVRLDAEAMLRNMRREGTPERVHVMELFLDGEIESEIAQRFGLWDGIDPNDPWAAWKRTIADQRFLGYDYVRCGLGGMDWPMNRVVAEDTAIYKRQVGRAFVDQHVGPITTWEEFEKYPWPDPDQADLRSLEWLEKNLPDDMCLIGGLVSHFAEFLNWLMGYETLCYALYDDRSLVEAIRDRLMDIERRQADILCQFDRVKIIWGSDDMGFRTGTLISPDDMREFVLVGHKMVAAKAHASGKLYILHSCGNLETIWPDLLDDVKIDGKHSFEDAIMSVIDHKRLVGDRVALIGGVDVDLITRADEPTIRARTREILSACMPGGGYFLGTGNSVANYIPMDHYLAMLDEGRRWGA